MKFKATYDHNHDTFRVEFLLLPAVVLALLINHDFTVLEVSSSIYRVIVCYNNPIDIVGFMDI